MSTRGLLPHGFSTFIKQKDPGLTEKCGSPKNKTPLIKAGFMFYK